MASPKRKSSRRQSARSGSKREQPRRVSRAADTDRERDPRDVERGDGAAAQRWDEERGSVPRDDRDIEREG